MKDIKVGDYIRTKYGIITQIETIKDTVVLTNEFIDVHHRYNEGIIEKRDIIKHSPNIIDLIEENDFVEIEYYSNRYKERVSRIFEVDFINENRDVCFENGHCRLNMIYGEWSNQDKLLNPIIKSIVTKEMFSSVEYRVENN